MGKPEQLIILLIASTLLMSGCIKSGSGETRYVCLDGHTVSDPQSCPAVKTEKEAEEKPTGVIVKYVCPDGEITLSKGECKMPEQQTKTIIKYVCQDGSIVEEKNSCAIQPETTDGVCAPSTTTTTAATTSILTTTTTPKNKNKAEENLDDEEEEEKSYESACMGLGCPAETEYVASKNSDKYHDCGCRWAERIKPENLVCFESKKEAEESGRTPCGVCKPK